jgi:hypothetical protein
VNVGEDDPFAEDPFAEDPTDGNDDPFVTDDEDPGTTEDPGDPIDTEEPVIDEGDWLQPQIPCQPDRVIVGSDVYDTVQEAVDAAASRAVVFVCRGKHSENLEIDGDAYLRGDDDVDVQIDGGGRAPTIRVKSGDLVVEWMTLQNGAGVRGGAIAQEGSGTISLRHTFVKNSRAELGGGVYGGGGAILIEDSTFSGNRATLAEEGLGGGLVTRGLLTIRSSAFDDNQAAKGAAFATSGPVEVSDTFIRRNTAAFGAVFLDEGAEASIQDVTFGANVGTLYGALVAYAAEVSLEDVVFEENGASESSDCIVSDSGSLNAARVTFRDNKFTRTGEIANAGCVHVFDGTATLEDVTFSGNGGGEGYAGAVTAYEGAEVELIEASFTGNAAKAGAALTATGSSIVCQRCTIEGNSAFWGGAVFAAEGADVRVEDGSFTGQTATYGVNVYANGASVSLADVDMNAQTVGAQGPVGWLYDDGELTLTRVNLTLPLSAGSILKEVEFGDGPGAGANLPEGQNTVVCRESTRTCVAP